MKKLYLAVGGVIGLLVVLALAGVTYLKVALPRVGPAPTMKVELTPARLERGHYLVNYLADCAGCHSPRMLDRVGLPADESRLLTGGFPISQLLAGIPGEITTPNLTPVHLASWTDGELYRAITSGVSKDGRPLFPMMPYGDLGTVDKEDVLSIIAYLRSLKPAGSEQPQNKLAFPFSLIARTIPKEAAHQPAPKPEDSVAYGRYLVKMGGCYHCHTPVDDHHKALPGMEGAGGQEFKISSNGTTIIVRPPNITPDPETGIGGWDKATFLNVIRTRAQNIGQPQAFGETNYIMPYREIAHLTDQDLGAIYDFLHSLKAVKNKVTRFEKL